MQRTIEIADFELPRGAVTIDTLMAMERPAWEHLRGEINRRRRLDPEKPLARCRQCKGPVYLRAQWTDGGHVPMFVHFTGTEPDCPWYQGINLTADDARAAQYRGHQETALHRWLCDTIADLLQRDPRCTRISVDRYLKPQVEERGRYPDIYAELDGLGKFAIEVQLSKPFAFEIAARHLHYEAEGVSLIWVFRELAEALPQGFRDVIAAQRGNAFLFDDAAFAAATEADGLRLSAYLEGDKGWLKPRLVALDDLDRGSGRSVFLEDRRTAKLLDHCQAGRAKWLEALRVGAPFDFSDPLVDNQFGPAWDSIRAFVPQLSAWKDAWWRQFQLRGRPHFLDLMAMLFSIQQSAEAGQDRLFVTRYKGDGSLVAMLNARLSGALFMRYADLCEAMLAGTACSPALGRSSLQTALATARRDAEQIGPGHPIWSAAARLFPEVFDGMLRAELADLRQLPGWATVPPVAASKAA
jgi:hypothetical protein